MLCFLFTGTRAQTIAKSVVAGAGGSYSGSSIMVDWTAGQAVAYYATTPSYEVTEGFLPLDTSTITVGPNVIQVIKKNDENGLSLNAYPNPVDGILHLTGTQNTAQPLFIQVKDIMGKTEQAVNLPAQLTINTDLDLSQLAAGIYFLLVGENGINMQVIRVVKD